MTSTRSSDYVAIGSGGNGSGVGSRSSRRLARGLQPGGKEEQDNNSTPVSFDVDDGNGGKVNFNSECKGDGNSNGPIDNSDDSDYNVNGDDNNNDDNIDNGGGAGQSTNVG